MNKIDLIDTTFVIPLRIDSEIRIQNTYLTIDWILKNFNVDIIVLEADREEKFIVDNEYVYKIYSNDNDRVFHRTKYLNYLFETVKTPYIGIWDADIIIDRDQILKSIQTLRTSESTLVFPYDGRFFNVSEKLKNGFIQKMDIKVLEDSKHLMPLIYGCKSVGGAFFVDKKRYLKGGGENEGFYGWGPEDIERVKRMEILGNTIIRIIGPLFHLDHPRKVNSGYESADMEKKNLRELIKICSMEKAQLQDYINSWAKR